MEMENSPPDIYHLRTAHSDPAVGLMTSDEKISVERSDSDSQFGKLEWGQVGMRWKGKMMGKWMRKAESFLGLKIYLG